MPKEGAVQIKYYSNILQCIAVLVLSHHNVTGQWELWCLYWQVFREAMGSRGLCPPKPTAVFIFTPLCKPYFVPV